MQSVIVVIYTDLDENLRMEVIYLHFDLHFDLHELIKFMKIPHFSLLFNYFKLIRDVFKFLATT